jgi:hypothetical protein
MDSKELLPAVIGEVPALYQARVFWEDGCGDWMNVSERQAEALRGERYSKHYQVRELFERPDVEAGAVAEDTNTGSHPVEQVRWWAHALRSERQVGAINGGLIIQMLESYASLLETTAVPATKVAYAAVSRKVLNEVLDALRFYSEGSNFESVTFQKGEREAQLKRLNADSGWEQYGEDSRGHEQFREDGTRAREALSALEEAFDPANPGVALLVVDAAVKGELLPSDTGWLPNCLVTVGVNGEGRVVLQEMWSTAHLVEDYATMVNALSEAGELRRLAETPAEVLVSDAEMNVMLEHFDISSDEGAKRFALHCVELASGRLSGKVAL